MSFYEDMRGNVADKLLTDFGQTLTLREENVDAIFDPETGFTTEAITTTEYNVTGVVLEKSGGSSSTSTGTKEVAGSNIVTGMKEVLMSALNPGTKQPLSVVPNTEMRLVADRTYDVVSVETLAPAGLTVMYKLRVQ